MIAITREAFLFIIILQCCTYCSLDDLNKIAIAVLQDSGYWIFKRKMSLGVVVLVVQTAAYNGG